MFLRRIKRVKIVLESSANDIAVLPWLGPAPAPVLINRLSSQQTALLGKSQGAIIAWEASEETKRLFCAIEGRNRVLTLVRAHCMSRVPKKGHFASGEAPFVQWFPVEQNPF